MFLDMITWSIYLPTAFVKRSCIAAPIFLMKLARRPVTCGITAMPGACSPAPKLFSEEDIQMLNQAVTTLTCRSKEM